MQKRDSVSVPRDTQKCEQEDCAERPFQAQSVSHRTHQTSLESKRTPRDFPRRLFLYPVPSAAARTAPNGVKERASFCLVFRSLNTTSSHRMFSMGYRRAKSTQVNTSFQKRIFLQTTSGSLPAGLKVLAEGYRLPLVSEPRPRVFENRRSLVVHEKFVDNAIAELVQCGSAREVSTG